jgi:hypothetical protein
VTGTAVLLYLQCYQAIPISGNPLQTFGGSAFMRKNATTASYYLADRSNLGIDVVDGQGLRFLRLLKPSTTDPVGGFIGQLIWTIGPATTATTRIGTPDENHSGPNGLAIYTDPSGANWMFVADGGCNTAIANATMATPSSAGKAPAALPPIRPRCRMRIMARPTASTVPVPRDAIRPSINPMSNCSTWRLQRLPVDLNQDGFRRAG